MDSLVEVQFLTKRKTEEEIYNFLKERKRFSAENPGVRSGSTSGD